ncbi:Hypothetical protein HEAR3022 [Herminiimonas arsenicoxydans]|uniref:Uncharacterized protein n=1 Tax=Herminiimonas arsenicoxydans TaxID=204773 RepID=A4G9E4_HERAR|nr:Hypothetical protein HEAR3022 [Herminiimonas arsenicoxydans]
MRRFGFQSAQLLPPVFLLIFRSPFEGGERADLPVAIPIQILSTFNAVARKTEIV